MAYQLHFSAVAHYSWLAAGGLMMSNAEQADGALTLEQAGRYLAVSPHTVRFYARTGRLPYYRPGRRLLFLRADLDAFLNACRVEPREQADGRAGHQLEPIA